MCLLQIVMHSLVEKGMEFKGKQKYGLVGTDTSTVAAAVAWQEKSTSWEEKNIEQ